MQTPGNNSSSKIFWGEEMEKLWGQTRRVVNITYIMRRYLQAEHGRIHVFEFEAKAKRRPDKTFSLLDFLCVDD